MHAIAPYSLRVFDSSITQKNREDRYHKLDQVMKHDLFELLKQFMLSLQSFALDKENKQAYRVTDLKYDDKKRVAWAWFEVGQYGMKSEIINIKNFQKDFEKGENNADIAKYFVFFFMPKGVNEGMALMHTIRSSGKKTLFYQKFNAFVRAKANRNIMMSPLSYSKTFSQWADAESKEIKVTRFSGASDFAEKVKKLGHVEKEMVIRAPRGRNLGRLKDFYNKGSSQAEVVEVLSEIGKKVTTTVEMNGVTRTFTVGSSSSSTLCEIALDEDEVKVVEGVPDFSDLFDWSFSIVKDFSATMYKKYTLPELV